MVIDLSAKPVEVTVQPYSPLAEEFPSDLGSSIADSLQSYVNDMLVGLHTNRRCSVSVKLQPERYDPLRPVPVFIDGSRCAQPISSYSSSPQEFLESMPELVEQIVCENRTLLISERLARDYRRAWGAKEEIDKFLFGLMRRLTGQGFSLNRVKMWLQSGGSADVNVDSAFEELAGSEPIPVQVHLPERHRKDRDSLSLDLSRFCAELGMGPVQVVVEFENLPRDWAFRVKINDLLLPPSRERALKPGEDGSRQ